MSRRRQAICWLLDDANVPYPVPDVLEWSAGFEAMVAAGRTQIARDEVEGITVSTVFLGVDHQNRMPEGPPLLFETASFEPMEIRGRYSTVAEALAGHARALASVRAWAAALVRLASRPS